jgi:hypothetical protein
MLFSAVLYGSAPPLLSPVYMLQLEVEYTLKVVGNEKLGGSGRWQMI